MFVFSDPPPPPSYSDRNQEALLSVRGGASTEVRQDEKSLKCAMVLMRKDNGRQPEVRPKGGSLTE